MTFKHRKICLAYLNCWALLEHSHAAKDQLWLQAIQKTAAYYKQQNDSISAIVLDLHFRQKLSKDKVLQQASIGGTSYNYAITDILSTLAVYAAQMGILPTYNEKEATK